MFEFLGSMLWIIITGIASIGGFVVMKRFVRERLRFVDGVRKPGIPLMAGVAASVVALPLTLFPVVNVLTAFLFGIGVGTGVAAGRRELKQLPSA